jgi:hypothetical protein
MRLPGAPAISRHLWVFASRRYCLSLTGLWDATLVRKHLQNPAYRGWWCCSAKKTKWSGKKDYAEQKLRSEPLKSGQFEYLRIISDAVGYRARVTS